MRPGSEGSNKSMTLLRKHDVDSSGYDKYEFNVTAPWSSDNAYLLIGSNKRSEYGDDNAFWIRFKDVSLVRGNRAADWSISLEDLVSNYKDLIKIEKDRVNGELTKHNSRIEQLEKKITMTVTETKYDSKMREIAKWQSKYEQTAREISTTVSKKVGNNEIISRINQTAESIKIDAGKINLNGYVTISNLSSGKTKVHPNSLKDFGMTTIDGGTITIDKLNIRRPSGDLMVQSGEMVAEYSGQRYEPDFSTVQPNHTNGRVWNPRGTFYTAPLVAIYGQNSVSSWKSLSQYNGYVDNRNSDGYTMVQAYRIIQQARYLVLRYGIKTDETGIFVRLAESSTTGTGLMASRSHQYMEEGSTYGSGGEFNLIIDLEKVGSRFGKGRLFYVKATTPYSDRALGNAAGREAKVRILGMYQTDTPPKGNANIVS